MLASTANGVSWCIETIAAPAAIAIASTAPARRRPLDRRREPAQQDRDDDEVQQVGRRLRREVVLGGPVRGEEQPQPQEDQPSIGGQRAQDDEQRRQVEEVVGQRRPRHEAQRVVQAGHAAQERHDDEEPRPVEVRVDRGVEAACLRDVAGDADVPVGGLERGLGLDGCPEAVEHHDERGDVRDEQPGRRPRPSEVHAEADGERSEGNERQHRQHGHEAGRADGVGVDLPQRERPHQQREKRHERGREARAGAARHGPAAVAVGTDPADAADVAVVRAAALVGDRPQHPHAVTTRSQLGGAVVAGGFQRRRLLDPQMPEDGADHDLRFDLEADGVDAQALECRAAKDAEAVAEVREALAVQAVDEREQRAVPQAAEGRDVGRGGARQEARALRKIDARAQPRDEALDLGGVHAAVGVEHDDDPAARRREAGLERGALAGLLGPHDDDIRPRGDRLLDRGVG
jgi:hypothetical protein